MYSFEEKEKIIEMLKSGTSLENLHSTYGIPMHILYDWQEEMLIRRRIKMLRQEGKIDEAEQELEKLSGDDSDPIVVSIKIGIAKARKEKAKLEGDASKEEEHRTEQKRLLRIQIENNPDNVITISGLIAIAREERNIREERKLLLRQLEINPNNAIAIKGLISLSRGEKRRDERRGLLYRLIDIEPDNIKTMITLIRMAEEDGNMEEIERLGNIILSIEPQNGLVRRILQDNGLKVKTVSMETIHELEAEMLRVPGEKEETKIQRARRIIHESNSPEQVAEEIKELLVGQAPTDVAIVLAELYYLSGLKERAEKHLKAYKKTLNVTSDREDIILINQAIELARGNNTQAFSWNKLWKNEKQDIAEMPSAPGDDGGR